MNPRRAIPYILLVLFIAGLLYLFPSGCTQPDDTTRVLSAQGYTNITITGWRPFMGSNGDVFSTGFSAKALNGSTVTGAVTSGADHGFTVRLD